MQTTIEETAKHKVKLRVEVPPDEFGKDLEATYAKIAQQAKIPGFRKGKVPRKVIDAQVGKDAVIQEFVHDSLHSYYMDAVREHDLAPIADPEIELGDVEEGKPLVFTAQVEIRPRLELDTYKGVKAERPSTDVTEPEIDEFVDRLRDRFAELDVVGRPAGAGDYAVIDLHGSVHGEEIPEATATDFLHEIGSGLLVPKLDEELEGKRKGEILKFNATLPEAFGDRAGQEVSFQVLIKEVKAKRLPEADDEFAKTASEFDTLAELRADLKEKLQEAKEREVEAVVRDRVLAALVDKVEVELPDRLVDEETEHRVKAATDRAERAGTSLQDVLEAQGWDELRFRSDARAHALRAIKADLVLEAVARQEDLNVSGDDLAEEIGRLAQAMGREPKELANMLNESGQITSLAGDIIRSKALDVIVEHAEVVPEAST